MVKNRHTVHLNDEVYGELDNYITKWGNAKEAIVNKAVYDYVYKRQNFLKIYAPHLNLEGVTQNAIFINDSELIEIAVVRVQKSKAAGNSEAQDSTSITLSCQSCKSEC